MTALVTIASPDLRVTVSPSVGGTITNVTHRATGLSVLGQVPWDTIAAPIASFAARDETEWLTRYTGGWPLLFPNGGDACSSDGVFHGFHGEASIAPWEFTASDTAIRLTRRFHTVPLEMVRELVVEGDVLAVHEHLRMLGSQPLEVMWGHHPTFGTDLLAGPVEITCGGGNVMVDSGLESPVNPLVPAATGQWPIVDGRHGPYDLSRPSGPISSLAYLYDFTDGWIAMRRTDNAIAAALCWDARRFPCVWLWYEINGIQDAPWNGSTSLIGLEPSTTMPAHGLATAKSRGSTVLRLSPGEEISTTLRLRVFKPDGPVTSPR